MDFDADPVLAGLPSLAQWAQRHGTRARQPLLLHSDGRYAAEVNEFFASARMRSSAEETRRKYVTELATWLGFLDAIGCAWSEAGPGEIDAFKFWRMTDEANPRRVAGGTVRSGLVAIRAFYTWAERRYGVTNPVAMTQIRRGRGVVEGFQATPRIVRDRDVKWLDPGGYRRWRDVGLRGLDLAGREVASWRGRNSQRDCAFAEGLYGTGLRLREWASVLQVELPVDDSARGFFACRLAAACGKGGWGRQFWMPRHTLSDVSAYTEGERAAAVRRAQVAGRYERIAERRIMVRLLGARRVELRDGAGRSSSASLDGLAPRARRRLFIEGPGGLIPAALWLNEDGLPREVHGWQHTFTTANRRVAQAGLVGLAATAHMLRHSFALRWFSVGRLVYERRFAHLDAAELRDFRAQFGDTWYFVMTLLGHRNVATTMNTYLEPFRDLDITLLIEHTRGAAIEGLLAELLRHHPQVLTDPLADRKMQ
ncbi:site-specific integrase [Nocardia wallacei]|uniref:Integrase n=1 Tax=Nocardia wallacei TaxID=480035 RepID=A0A7G1KLY7_9NOCA|nr:site-specific integrase [Nocardia wallacei]BCK56202.1 integrase [Nocardia wallacei]